MGGIGDSRPSYASIKNRFAYPINIAMHKVWVPVEILPFGLA